MQYIDWIVSTTIFLMVFTFAVLYIPYALPVVEDTQTTVAIETLYDSLVSNIDSYNVVYKDNLNEPTPFAFEPDLDWFSTHWKNRIKIKINHNKVNGNIPLTNFPVFLDLSLFPESFFENINEDGGDIRIFLKDNITEVPREIVYVDILNKEGVVWFKPSVLSNNKNTYFYIYYNNPLAEDYSDDHEYGTHNVWTNNYIGVWHKNDLTDTTIKDSTSFSHHGTKRAGTEPQEIDGIVGKAQDYTGDQVSTNAGTASTLLADTMTISAWVYPKSYDVHYPIFVRKGDYYRTGLRNPGDGRLVTWFRVNGTIRSITSIGEIPIDTWTHTISTYDGTNIRIYIDGELNTTSNDFPGTITSSTEPLILGGYNTAGNYSFDGLIDEIHISSIARSEEWISTEYNNQISPSTFYVIEDEETLENNLNKSDFTTKYNNLIWGITSENANIPDRKINKTRILSFQEDFETNKYKDYFTYSTSPEPQRKYNYLELDANTWIKHNQNNLWYDSEISYKSNNIDLYFSYVDVNNHIKIEIRNNNLEMFVNDDNNITSVYSGEINNAGWKMINLKIDKDNFYLTYDNQTHEITNKFNKEGVIKVSSIDLANWNNRIKITVDKNKVDGDTNITDFPVYLDLSLLPDSFFENVKEDGGDIRITKGDGVTELPREIVSINTDTNTGEVWFKADVLKHDKDTSFYIYFNNPNAEDYKDDHKYGVFNVWTNGYVGVWNFGEGQGTVGYDSSGNNNHATIPGSEIGEWVSPSGFNKTSLSTTGITIPDNEKISFNEEESFSISAIFEINEVSDGERWGILYKGGGPSSYGISGRWANIQGGFRTNPSAYYTVQFTPDLSKIYYATLVIDSSINLITFYIDGQSIGTRSYDLTDKTISNNSVWEIYGVSGIAGNGTTSNGFIKNARINNVVRPSEWISTEYNNQSDPNSFFTFGEVESENLIQKPLLNRISIYKQSDLTDKIITRDNKIKIIINKDKVSGNTDLIDFPVYFDLSLLPETFFESVRSDGGDIRIKKEDEVTELPREIVSIDTFAKTGEIWFKADVLKHDEDTAFYIYYNNPLLEDYPDDHEFGKHNVWTNNYISVFHKDDYNSTTIKDSTSFENYGLKNSTNKPQEVDGFIGKAQKYDGVNDYMILQNNTLNTDNSGTISAIVETNTLSNDGNLERWIISHQTSTTDRAYLAMYDESWQVGLGSQYIRNLSSIPINERLITTLVWNNNNYSLFVNGIIVNNGSYTGTVKTDNGLWHIGRWSNDNRGYWEGIIDNIRISSTPRSEDWIKTEFNNQSDVNSFFEIYYSETEISGDHFKFNIFDNVIDVNLKKINKNITYEFTNENILITNKNNKPIYFIENENINIRGAIFPSTPEYWIYKAKEDDLSIDTNGFTIFANEEDCSDYIVANNRIKITIDKEKVDGNSHITNFPVFLDLSLFPESFFENVKEDGGDIRITSENTRKELPREIVSIDTNAHSGEVWFKADVLKHDEDTIFYVYFNNPLLEDYPDDHKFGTHNVWSNGYVGVWHKDDYNSTTIKDSTSFENHGTKKAINEPQEIDGIIGKAQQYDESAVITTTPFSTNTNLTACFWAKPLVSETKEMVIHGSVNNGSFEIFQAGTSVTLRGGASTPQIIAGGVLSIGDWRFICGVIENNFGKIFSNGILINSGAIETPTLQERKINIGAHENLNYDFNGLIDDVKISIIARSDEWIKTEFNNQSNPLSFYTIGDLENTKLEITSCNKLFLEDNSNNLISLSFFKENTQEENYCEIIGLEEELEIPDDMVLHLDASAIEGKEDGNKIETWQDLSGNNNHAIQTNTNKQPIYKINELNGLPIIEWTGSESLSSDMGIYDLPIDVFIVTKSESNSTTVIHDGYLGSTGQEGLLFLEDDGVGVESWRMYVNDSFILNSPENPNNWNILNSLYNGANSEWRVNGNLLNVGDTGTTNTAQLITIGSDRSEEKNLEGGIAEIIIYDRKLTDQERQQVEKYLEEKWLGYDPTAPQKVLHLDASAIEGKEDGDKIETWQDLSGNNNHATQTTEANRPTYKTDILNGKPIVRFDGEENYFIINHKPELNAGSQMSIFTVRKRKDGFRLFQKKNNDIGLSVDSWFYSPSAGFSVAGQWSGITFYSSDVFLISSDIFNSSLGNIKAYENGVLVNTHNATTEQTPNTDDLYFGIRNRNSGEGWFEGDIAEIIIYDKALTDEERQDVEKYLGEKWLGYDPTAPQKVLHLDASSIEGKEDGDKIETWQDLSGNNNHATQTTEANRPTYKTDILNGKPIVRFDGINNNLYTDSAILGDSHQLFFVVKAPKDDQRNGLFGQWSSGTTNRYIGSLHENPTSGTVLSNAIKGFIDGKGHFGTTDVINTEDFFIISWQKDTSTYRIFIDSDLKLTETGIPTSVEQRSLCIGDFTETVNNPARVDIAEIIIYDRALTDEERQDVEKYLGEKWLGYDPTAPQKVLHLDALTIEGKEDGDKIETWQDLSGNNNHATQTTEANRPTYKTNILNGNPVVRFDGISDQLELLTNITSSKSWTRFFVVNAKNDGFWIFSEDPTTNQKTGRWENNYFTRVISGGELDTSNSWIFGEDHILITERRNNENKIDVGFNGGSYNRLFNDNAQSGNSTISYIGSGELTSQYLEGDIAEIIIYDRALTNEKRQEVEQQLGEKWLGWGPPEPEEKTIIISNCEEDLMIKTRVHYDQNISEISTITPKYFVTKEQKQFIFYDDLEDIFSNYDSNKMYARITNNHIDIEFGKKRREPTYIRYINFMTKEGILEKAKILLDVYR